MQLSSPRPGTGGGSELFGRQNSSVVTKWRSAMPPRKPDLPEGTDHIVRGASAEDEAETGSRVRTPPVRWRLAATKDKLVGQVREQVSSLRGQAGDQRPRLCRRRQGAGHRPARGRQRGDRRGCAGGRAASSAPIMRDYAHRASGAVSGFADKVRDQDGRRSDRRHARVRPQEPGHRHRHRRGRGLHAGPPDQDRAGRHDRPPRPPTTEPELGRRGGARKTSRSATLLGRLAEDGRAYVKAEIGVYGRSPPGERHGPEAG